MKYYQKGVSLYLAISIMAVLLAIVFGLNAILINQIKTTGEIEKSVVAFFAADTGIERVLKEIKNDESDLQGSYSSVAGDFTNPDVFYEVTVNCSPTGTCPASVPSDVNCSSPRYCIKSIGTFRGVKRAIEVTSGGFSPEAEQEYEYYDEEVGSYRGLFNRHAQIFTVGSVGPNQNHIAVRIELPLTKVGSPLGNVVVSFERAIFDAGTGGYIPDEDSNVDCSTGAISADSLPVGGWAEIDLAGSNCNLIAGQQYAIIGDAPDVDWLGCQGPSPTACVLWSSNDADPDANPYINGNLALFIGSWQASPAFDLLFRIYGPASYLPLWKEISPF